MKGHAMKVLLTILPLATTVATAQQPTAPPPFAERAREMVEYYAHPQGPGDSGYATIAARLKLHEDPAWCSRRLLELLQPGPEGDMFWMFPVVSIAYLDQGQLTPEARQALRRSWKTYMPYRGDTENHWLLYYTSLYLAAQMWPGEPGDAWFTGKTSEENLREAREYIESWVKLTTRRGQGEYDCTHYMGLYLLPMSYLSAWAKDPQMQRRATMMLDYLIAGYAVNSLNGTYVGAHARTDDVQVLEKWNGTSTNYGWLLFGLGPHTVPQGYPFFYTLASAYQPPEILQRIATDRAHPYTEYERKRTRNRWRFHDERHGPIYKTTYMRSEYAVGSDQGGVLQPIQQHSWDVTWNVADPRGVQNTLFFLNPHSSMIELQAFFTFGPDFGTEAVVRSKKSYDSPDKFLGGSPYEKIVQDTDTLISLYNIPRQSRFPHINGFFSKDLAEMVEDPSGWIFARGGDALIACRPLQPWSWKPIAGGGRRLFSPYLQNGVVMQVAARSEFAGMAEFRRAILALPLEVRLEPVPHVRFRSLRGRTLDFTWGDTPSVDGRPLNYEQWPLFGGPFLEAEVDSERLLLKHGSMRRLLDFRTLTVHDEP
jgi:hypothetical protein